MSSNCFEAINTKWCVFRRVVSVVASCSHNSLLVVDDIMRDVQGVGISDISNYVMGIVIWEMIIISNVSFHQCFQPELWQHWIQSIMIQHTTVKISFSISQCALLIINIGLESWAPLIFSTCIWIWVFRHLFNICHVCFPFSHMTHDTSTSVLCYSALELYMLSFLRVIPPIVAALVVYRVASFITSIQTACVRVHIVSLLNNIINHHLCPGSSSSLSLVHCSLMRAEQEKHL